jgi:hypothetical protein
MVLVYHRSLALAGIGLSGIVLLSSCESDGDDGGYVQVSQAGSGGPEGDAGDAAADGSMDGGLPIDGPTMDAAVLGLDATLDLPPGTLIFPDGAILLPDGQVIDVDAAIDRFEREIDVSTCEIADEEPWSALVDFNDESGFSLEPGGVTGFGLAYRSTTDGNHCPENVNVMRIPSSEGFEARHALFEDCQTVRSVALLGTTDTWQVTWVYNQTGSAELHTLALDEDMNPAEGAERVRVTDNENEQERDQALAELDGRPLAAWYTTPPSPDEDGFPIRTRFLDGESEIDTIVEKAAAHRPVALGLAATSADNAALAWVSTTENPGVWLQRLDHDGAAVGDPVLLNDRVGASASIDVAARAKGGGAVLYTTEINGIPQVRFRRLSETGEPVDIEKTLIGPPLRAQAASIHEIGGGYAVAYRALPGGDITEPEVRLTFITKEGNLTKDGAGRLVSFPISATEGVANGRTSIAVSIDGAIMVAWTDEDADTSHDVLKVVRRKLASCQQ